MTAPEVPHADLIARLRGVRSKWGGFPILDEAADALAALGDTVPREQYDQMRADRFSEGWTAAHAHFTPQITTAKRERDAFAHVIEQAPHALLPLPGCDYLATEQADRPLPCTCYKSTAPAVSLALHDAEVWDEGFDRGVEYEGGQSMDRANPYRAAAIREDTIKEDK